MYEIHVCKMFIENIIFLTFVITLLKIEIHHNYSVIGYTVSQIVIKIFLGRPKLVFINRYDEI